jgi:hypothetical protein
MFAVCLSAPFAADFAFPLSLTDSLREALPLLVVREKGEEEGGGLEVGGRAFPLLVEVCLLPPLLPALLLCSLPSNAVFLFLGMFVHCTEGRTIYDKTKDC